jgi:DNA polymerase-1
MTNVPLPQTQPNAVYIVDLNYFIYSGHYAVYLSSRGKAMGGAYTTIKNLLRVRKMSPYVIIALDSEYSFKKERAKSYKSHRVHVPEIQYQREAVIAFLVTMGLPLAREHGYEADDVIATLAYHFRKHKRPSVIVGVDKDLCALVNEYCFMLNMSNGRYMDRIGVVSQYGAAPEIFEDFLALVGDPADGFKGMPGIGKMGAKMLLQQFGSIKGMLENVEKMPDSYKRKFSDEKNIALLRESIIMAALDRNVPNLEKHYNPKEHSFNKDAFNELCEFHGFKSLIQL